MWNYPIKAGYNEQLPTNPDQFEIIQSRLNIINNFQLILIDLKYPIKAEYNE